MRPAFRAIIEWNPISSGARWYDRGDAAIAKVGLGTIKTGLKKLVENFQVKRVVKVGLL